MGKKHQEVTAGEGYAELRRGVRGNRRPGVFLASLTAVVKSSEFATHLRAPPTVYARQAVASDQVVDLKH